MKQYGTVILVIHWWLSYIIMKNFLISAVILVFVSQSCSNSFELRERLRAIKEVGNSNPRLALQMLDSVKTDIYGCDEHTRNTFSLLNIRLNDKADIIPSSDIEIRKVLDYFSSEGSPSELQEAYYYAGSVYRDLRDTPKSLLFFSSLSNWRKARENATLHC